MMRWLLGFIVMAIGVVLVVGLVTHRGLLQVVLMCDLLVFGSIFLTLAQICRFVDTWDDAHL